MSGDVHQLNFAYTAGGSFMESVMFFQQSAASSPTPEADSFDLTQGFNINVLPVLLPLWGDDVVYLGVRAKRVNNTGGPSVVVPAASGTVGTGTGSSTNERTAALFTTDYYNTPSAHPRWRVGRMFLGGYFIGAFTEGRWQTTFLTPANALTTLLNTGFMGTAISWTSGVWSRKYTTFFPTLPTGWELSPVVGALSRRQKPHI
jgi:hypothetical protein